MRLPHAFHTARNTGCQMRGLDPFAVHFSCLRIQEHIAVCFAGGFLPKIEGVHLAIRHTHDHEPAAADITGIGIHDGQRKLHGDRRIHGVATPAEDVGTHLCGCGMRAYHHGRITKKSMHPVFSVGRCCRINGLLFSSGITAATQQP